MSSTLLILSTFQQPENLLGGVRPVLSTGILNGGHHSREPFVASEEDLLELEVEREARQRSLSFIKVLVCEAVEERKKAEGAAGHGAEGREGERGGSVTGSEEEGEEGVDVRAES